jgi:chromosome segregation ATPase
MSDDFWQNQVQRLMQETKNYKQLHFEQKMEMKEIVKQNTELKKKVKRFRKQKDELNHSLNEFKNSNESNSRQIIVFRLCFNIRKSKHNQ